MNNEHLSLTKKERLEYIYLLKILEKLYPEQSEEYSQYRNALQQGFSLHYADMMIELSEDELSINECRKVLDILEMYRGIIYSYRALKRENTDISLTDEDVKFPGFDGNNECYHMAYVKYFIDDLDRYSEIQELSNGYYNSHHRMLSQYEKMLEKWNEFESLPNRYLMNEEQIRELLNSKFK
ncbi:YfbU family protein [Porphyromonas sp. HMSC065F10]|uniref:YfbU family protein n=1 Tax=Porphyromonas sp. HMSC065F10 TaxID=1739394 RepID=UPI0008A37D09|nr:YfbU family protein [Porphyromonas sp. HMSC065F10]OFR41231.1 hypothetical protein HMPREF2890_00630 [Porphyromonas sp. HMSC065F10]